ncbi:RNA polymerase sigma factor [Stieleria sp.]|uniref:RNA polymerase sigma factor n=1 Tax=Stieleria sp. TaxID=2795976 RepID=UPI0035619BAD
MTEHARFRRLADDARGGCQASLGQLLQQVRPYLLSVANDLVNSQIRPKCSGSDLVQDATLNAARNFKDFQGTSELDLVRWLVAILKHRMVDVHRSYVTSAKRRLADEQPIQWAEQLEARDLAERSVQEHRIERMLAHIDRLPSDARMIVLLRHEQGLSFLEIGNRMGISHEAARKRWHKSLRQLKRSLSEDLK